MSIFDFHCANKLFVLFTYKIVFRDIVVVVACNQSMPRPFSPIYVSQLNLNNGFTLKVVYLYLFEEGMMVTSLLMSMFLVI